MPLTGIEYEEVLFEDRPIHECPNLLSPLLEDLLSALKENDTIMIGDISEYELAPRISRLGETLSQLRQK